MAIKIMKYLTALFCLIAATAFGQGSSYYGNFNGNGGGLTNVNATTFGGTPPSAYQGNVINVFSNGFTMPFPYFGFQSEPGPGASLQAALNWSTNLGSGIFAIDPGPYWNQGDSANPVYFSSNLYSAHLILEGSTVFYQHGPFIYPSSWASGSIWIDGAYAPGSPIVCDSNVIWPQTISNGFLYASCPSFRLSGCTICESNFTAKCVKVMAVANTWNYIEDNLFCPYVMLNSNYPNSWDSGNGNFGGTPLATYGNAGAIDIMVNGGTEDYISRNDFVAYATAIVTGPHAKIDENYYIYGYGSKFGQVGSAGYIPTPAAWTGASFTLPETNVWATNDIATYYKSALQGWMVSLGARIIIQGTQGGGDVEVSNEKGQIDPCGIFVDGGDGGAPGPNYPYGIPKLNNVSFEDQSNLTYNIIMYSPQGSVPGNNSIIAQNCTGQNLFTDDSLLIWNITTNNFWVTPETIADTTNVLTDIGVYNNQFKVKVNNQEITHEDATGFHLDYASYSGNGAGLTNIQDNDVVSVVTKTNWLSGAYYTNNTGASYVVWSDETFSTVASAGVQGFQLIYDPLGGHNWITNCDGSQGVTTLSISGMAEHFRLSGPIATNGVYCWTNVSTVGTASLINGYIR